MPVIPLCASDLRGMPRGNYIHKGENYRHGIRQGFVTDQMAGDATAPQAASTEPGVVNLAGRRASLIM